MIELITDAYDPVRPFSGWIIVGALVLAIVLIIILSNLKGKRWREEALLTTWVAGTMVPLFLSVNWLAHTEHFDFPMLKEDLEGVGFESVNMVTGSDSRTVDNRFTAMQKRTFVECVITEEIVKGTYEVWCEPVK